MLSAFDLLAAVCDALSDEQAGQLLRLVEPLIERPANHYKHTDEAVAKILATMAVSRPEALPLLARALVADQRMAEVILKRPDVLAANRDVVARLLTPFAAGSRHAALRSSAQAPTLPQRLTWRKPRSSGNSPRDSTSRESRCSTPVPLKPRCWRRCSIQKSALGSPAPCSNVRLTASEVTYSRWNDLAGLANIASEIDEGTQASLLPQVLEIARGQHDGGPADDNVGGTGTLSDLGLSMRRQPQPCPRPVCRDRADRHDVSPRRR